MTSTGPRSETSAMRSVASLPSVAASDAMEMASKRSVSSDPAMDPAIEPAMETVSSPLSLNATRAPVLACGISVAKLAIASDNSLARSARSEHTRLASMICSLASSTGSNSIIDAKGFAPSGAGGSSSCLPKKFPSPSPSSSSSLALHASSSSSLNVASSLRSSSSLSTSSLLSSSSSRTPPDSGRSLLVTPTDASLSLPSLSPPTTRVSRLALLRPPACSRPRVSSRPPLARVACVVAPPPPFVAPRALTYG
mmetsp:Transcript_7027/g.25679  ORF Transcript_7027/g.25679 Transcript_7027/m.25679 type:complete len:253 (-) Transcript_7027:342-1100(-)